MDQGRQRTKRTTPLKTKELIEELNPLLRGWVEYYRRAHIRKLFQRLDGWVRRRIWSHRYKCWRNAGWKRLPAARLSERCNLSNSKAALGFSGGGGGTRTPETLSSLTAFKAGGCASAPA